jgi:hypothetical protein
MLRTEKYLDLDIHSISSYSKVKKNSNLLSEFYNKTPFCRTHFLEHEERSEECEKANKYDKMAYKTSVIQYFFYFAPILHFKF